MYVYMIRVCAFLSSRKARGGRQFAKPDKILTISSNVDPSAL